MSLYDDVRAHQEHAWGPACDEIRLARGAMPSLDRDFCVSVFAPRAEQSSWTYATCGMGVSTDRPAIELHLHLDQRRDDECAEILTAVAWFHRAREPLDLHHPVWFGRPWIDGSRLAYGLVSLPYIEDPAFERQVIGAREVEQLWLLPITRGERELKIRDGVEALERRFEEAGLEYANPFRASVV